MYIPQKRRHLVVSAIYGLKGEISATSLHNSVPRIRKARIHESRRGVRSTVPGQSSGSPKSQKTLTSPVTC